MMQHKRGKVEAHEGGGHQVPDTRCPTPGARHQAPDTMRPTHASIFARHHALVSRFPGRPADGRAVTAPI